MACFSGRPRRREGPIPGRASGPADCLAFLVLESEGMLVDYQNHLTPTMSISKPYDTLLFQALKNPLLRMRAVCEIFYRLYEDEFWC